MNKIFIQLLIDRTGSMRERWAETITAINAYVAKVTEGDDIDATVGLAFFDRSPPDPVLQWKPDAKRGEWTPLSATDPTIQPHGMTPLFDAIVEAAAKFRARPTDPGEVRQFVVMTDGEENSSQEANLETVRKTIADLEAAEIPVTFLGAGPEAFSQGATMGTVSSRSAHVGARGMTESMSALALKSRAYAMSKDATSLDYTDDERKKISED